LAFDNYGFWHGPVIIKGGSFKEQFRLSVSLFGIISRTTTGAAIVGSQLNKFTAGDALNFKLASHEFLRKIGCITL